MDWQIIWLNETTSTNDALRQLAQQGAPAGTVVVADHQTAGRGRRGNPWVAPAGRNLLVSILLRPEFPMEIWPQLTHATALALAQFLESTGLTPQIKWPNDVLVNDRKICGILLETFTHQEGAFVILGLGLNVNETAEEFPPELASTATSLAIETQRPWDREEVLDSLLQHIDDCWWRVAEHFPAMLRAVERRSHLTGHRISLEREGRVEQGIVRGLSHSGGLLLEDDSGQLQVIHSAETLRKI